MRSKYETHTRLASVDTKARKMDKPCWTYLQWTNETTNRNSGGEEHAHPAGLSHCGLAVMAMMVKRCSEGSSFMNFS